MLSTGSAADGEVEDYAVKIFSVVPQVESVTINDGVDPSRSKVSSLTLQFDTEVDHAALDTAFTITNVTSSIAVGSVNVSATDSGGKTRAVLTFSGASTLTPIDGSLSTTRVDGNYRLDIVASQVRLAISNAAAMSIDYKFGGQPKAEPSNDNFFRWYGDANGEGFTDFTGFASVFLPSFGTERPEIVGVLCETVIFFRARVFVGRNKQLSVGDSSL